MLRIGATTGVAVAVAVAAGVMVAVGLGRGVLVRKSRVAGNGVSVSAGIVGSAAVGNAVGNPGVCLHAPANSKKPINKYLLIISPFRSILYCFWSRYLSPGAPIILPI